MLILIPFCLRPWVSHILLQSTLKWGAQSLTSKIPPPDSNDSALALRWKSASVLWMELFQMLNAVVRANIQLIYYLNKKWVLSSPHKIMFLLILIFLNSSFLFQCYFKWTLSCLFGRLFSFHVVFKLSNETISYLFMQNKCHSQNSLNWCLF